MTLAAMHGSVEVRQLRTLTDVDDMLAVAGQKLSSAQTNADPKAEQAALGSIDALLDIRLGFPRQ